MMLAGKFSSRYADKIEQKTTKVEEQLTKQSQKALQRLQKGQQKAYKALHKIDSNAATAFLLNSQKQYEATLATLKTKAGNVLKAAGTYVPGLDSMNGVLKYLNKLPNTDALPGKEKIRGALAAVANAGHSLDKATEIKKLMQQQEQQLKALAARYKDLNISKQLRKYNSELYYYTQRVSQIKNTLNDPGKIEQQVLKLLRKNEGFRNWMQQNGQLAGLFGNPNAATAQNVAGLQTRQSVQQLLQSRLGGSAQQAQQQMSAAVQQAQVQLNNLRNRLQQLGAGTIGNGTGDMTMPDFKPNNQKTKSFLKRLEYGINLQSQKSNRWLPSTTDVGLSVGYKLNDKSIVGIGVAYKLGWGQPISHIRFSHEGIGLRSYFDYKLKGSFWLSGGYEQNYNSSFANFEVLKNLSAWQRSGLIGLSKKIKQGKRLVETKLLWDFLSYRQVPKTQAVLFRMGYSFN